MPSSLWWNRLMETYTFKFQLAWQGHHPWKENMKKWQNHVPYIRQFDLGWAIDVCLSCAHKNSWEWVTQVLTNLSSSSRKKFLFFIPSLTKFTFFSFTVAQCFNIKKASVLHSVLFLSLCYCGITDHFVAFMGQTCVNRYGKPAQNWRTTECVGYLPSFGV